MQCPRRRRALPSAPTEPCSTTAAGEAHPGDRESQYSLAERSLLVLIQKPKTRTLQPLLFVEAIILCRFSRNTEQTMCKVTSFQIWIHSRAVVDFHQHLVICSRSFSQRLHHAHVRPSGAVGWYRERLSWDSAAPTRPQPVAAPGKGG